MSSVLGVLSLASIVLAVYGTFQNQGEALVKYGAAVLFALLFSLAGLVLGILSRMVQDRFYFFSYLVLLNILKLIIFIISHLHYTRCINSVQPVLPMQK